MSNISPQQVERFARQGRSAVTNGKRLVIGVDARSKHGRRFRDLVTAYTDEIGGSLTASDQAMVKQAAALAVRAEMAQAEIINGTAVNVDDMVRLCSESRRLIDNLKGKAEQRKPNAAPDLKSYLASKAAGQAA